MAKQKLQVRSQRVRVLQGQGSTLHSLKGKTGTLSPYIPEMTWGGGWRGGWLTLDEPLETGEKVIFCLSIQVEEISDEEPANGQTS